MLEKELKIDVVEIEREEDLGKSITELFDKILPMPEEIKSPEILILSGSGPTAKFTEVVRKSVNKYSFTEPQTIESADSETCTRLVEIAQKENIVALLNVGGGKVLDVGKFVGSYHKKPVFNLATTASHDGIASPRAVIKNKNYHTSINVDPPRGIFLYWPWILGAPIELILSGVGDLSDKPNANADWLLTAQLLAKGDNVKEETPFSEIKSQKCVNAFKKVLDVLHEIEETGEPLSPRHPTWEKFVKITTYSLIDCGIQMSLLDPKSSRPASGSAHLISHAFDTLLEEPRSHGFQVGVGAVISYGIRHLYPDKYLVEKPYGIGLEEVVKSFKYAGIPKHWKELGIDDGVMVNAIIKARELGKDRWFNQFEYIQNYRQVKIDGIFANQVLKGIEKRYEEMGI